MTTQLEKQFFDTYKIEKSVREWQQYNHSLVAKGLQVYETRKKLEEDGFIKITQRKLQPSEFNDCVYWEEYLYPPILCECIIKLFLIANEIDFGTKATTIEELKNDLLTFLIEEKDDIVINEVRRVFR